MYQVLLAVACATAEPFWPLTYGAGMPYTYPVASHYYSQPLVYNKPVEIKPLKVEEYTKTFEYKTGTPEYLPYWYPYKMTKMPEVETKYAAQGEYEAVSAGGVVHKAKREADPLTIYSNWAMPYVSSKWSTPYVSPLTYSSQVSPLTYGWPAATMYGMPILKPIEPKPVEPIVADDRLKEGTPDYAMKNQYEAVSAGVIHKAKREADPALLYYKNIIPPTYTSPLRYTSTPLVSSYTYTKPLIYGSNPYMWY